MSKTENHILKDIFIVILFFVLYYISTHNQYVRPTPIQTPGKWSIEKAVRPILFNLVGHNYIILRNDAGQVVEELQGLPTNPSTGLQSEHPVLEYLKNKKAFDIKVWNINSSLYKDTKSSPSALTLFSGDKDVVLLMWQKARDCAQIITEKKIPYPTFGLDFNGMTANSNSVANTILSCAGLPTPHVGTLTPGSNTNALKRKTTR